MARFVVLEHDWPGLHWDFMLETGENLKTWRLAEPPQIGKIVRAEPIGDHRPAYLEYEGPVSGNRGSVRRWDRGTYRWVEQTVDQMMVYLEGEKYQGKAVFLPARNEWHFIGSALPDAMTG